MIITKVYLNTGAIAQTDKNFFNYIISFGDDEIKRLTEMAEIAAYCHNLSPIKAFLWFHWITADISPKRLVWRFLIFWESIKNSPYIIVRKERYKPNLANHRLVNKLLTKAQ